MSTKELISRSGEPKLVRLEYYQNTLSVTHVGNYIVPIWEEMCLWQEGKSNIYAVDSWRGQPLYVQAAMSWSEMGVTAEVLMAANTMLAVQKVCEPVLLHFFENQVKDNL